MEDISSSLLGRIAVAGGYLTDDQLQVCLHEQEIQQQEKREVLRLGEIMKKKGFISEAVLGDLLEVQRSLSSGLFGEIAVRMKMADAGQVEKALRIQGKAKEMGYATGPIGELMKEKGYITDADIEKILKIQEEYTVTCSECGMKYNAWKLAPGQEISCAICGNPVRFEPSFAPADDDDSGPDAQDRDKEIVPEIPGYRITEKLGHGEDSIVYKAVQRSKNRDVTIQFVKGISARNAEYMKRLQDEARRAIALHHPSLKKIYAIGKHEEHPYIVSEYVEGESLFNVIKREGRLPVLGATEIIIQVAEALDSALQEEIVHGDIKPSLILMLDNGTVKISNLGIAKKTRRDVVSVEERNRFITYYMAPEIIIGKNDPDISSDIYSLGAVYFHMLAGNPPYEGRSPKEIIISISAGPAAALANAPQIPPSVSSCIEKMLAKVPRDRYAGYDLLLAELKKIREDISDVPRIRKTTTGVRRKKTTETGSMRGIRNRETSTSRYLEGSVAEARIAFRERDKTTPAVLILRLFAVFIIAGVLLILYILLKKPLGLTDTGGEQKETGKTVQQAAEDTEIQQDNRTQTDPDVKEEPKELAEDVKTQLALLVRRTVYDITEYAAVKKEIETIRAAYGEHEEITEALENIEGQRKDTADTRAEKAEKEIKEALASNRFKTAMETARKHIDVFYGIPQSKRIEELRLSISEKMAEYFITVREKVGKYSEEGKYIEALSFLSDVIKRLPEGGLKKKAEQMKKEMEHALAVKNVEDESAEGAERLELVIKTHRDILSFLGIFDISGAEMKLETFRKHPEGSGMKKAAEALSEEIGLIRKLKTRIIDLVNRGVIKVRCRVPGSDEEITITKADGNGITAGPVSLKWQLVEKDIMKKLASSACDMDNPSHLAQLAVFFLAKSDPKMALTWYARSGAKGYDAGKLSAVFPTQNDFEAEELFKRASALFKKGEQNNECLELLTKLQNEYSGSPAAVVNRREIKRMAESILHEQEKEPEDDAPAPEPDTEKQDIPKEDTLNLKELKLAFQDESDIKYIRSESGAWKVEDGVLVGTREARRAAGCMARILLTEPYSFSGRLKFRDTGSAITLQLGETKIIADLTTDTLFFEDANKERKQRPFEFKVNTWYEFKISINRDGKKVSFSFSTQQSEGSCEVISNDIVILSDQDNTVYLDDLDMRMKERPQRDVVP